MIVAGLKGGGGGPSGALATSARLAGEGVGEQPARPTTIRTAPIDQPQPGELKGIRRLDNVHRLDEQDVFVVASSPAAETQVAQ